MRTLAIGDIHGCFTALTTLERFVPFSAEDRTVTLGDYVDRGPDSCQVLDWLIARQAAGTLVPLRGNHELMMCSARQDLHYYEEWLRYGGNTVLASYSARHNIRGIDDLPAEHWRFLDEELRPYFETATHFFVHANAYPDVPLAEQPEYMLYWEKFNDPPPHESGKIMICGHTPQPNGVPRSIGHAICIDTGVYRAGWLTCLDVDTGQYWQANQKGETRAGMLEVDA